MHDTIPYEPMETKLERITVKLFIHDPYEQMANNSIKPCNEACAGVCCTVLYFRPFPFAGITMSYGDAKAGMLNYNKLC